MVPSEANREPCENSANDKTNDNLPVQCNTFQREGFFGLPREDGNFLATSGGQIPFCHQAFAIAYLCNVQ